MTVIHPNLQQQEIDLEDHYSAIRQTSLYMDMGGVSCFWGMWSVMLSVLDGSSVELGKSFFPCLAGLCWLGMGPSQYKLLKLVIALVD